MSDQMEPEVAPDAVMVLTTSGDLEVIKAADVREDAAETEEPE